MNIPEKQLHIATIKDIDVYFSASPISERFITKEGAHIIVSSLEQQNLLRDRERPLVKATTIADSSEIFIPIHVGYVDLANSLLLRVDEVLTTNTNKPHKMLGLKAKLAMLADIETVFYGSEVIGPEILLP